MIYDIVNQPAEELSIIIQNTAVRKGVSNAIIEKDLWVCVVLEYLFIESPWKDKLAFKGGTSLSKAYDLIERFSEDIDLILDWRVLGYKTSDLLMERSINQMNKISKEISDKTREFLNNDFLPKIKVDLHEKLSVDIDVMVDDEIVVIDYRNGYNDESILHTIRLEIGALAAWTPTEYRKICPYIAEMFADKFKDNSVVVRTTTAERTFWEKATILHREAHRLVGTTVPPRMSRHYYDLYRMIKLGVLDSAMKNTMLLDQVAQFKAKFYPQRSARYDLATIGSLCLVPPDSSMSSIKKDYIGMQNMIYGDAPSFEELIQCIAETEKQINKH